MMTTTTLANEELEFKRKPSELEFDELDAPLEIVGIESKLIIKSSNTETGV
ncbi:MAG: hypothetical protein LBV23_06700 [Deltaproteobacteria bacterium]|jgi:hypothetical protein|nr:hypothetical protein [Deltaproteobacteria bacterium]